MGYKKIESLIIEGTEYGNYIIKDSTNKKPIAKISKIIHPSLEKFIEHFHSNDITGIICAVQSYEEVSNHEYHLILRKDCEYLRSKHEDVSVLIVKMIDENYHPRHDYLVKNK